MQLQNYLVQKTVKYTLFFSFLQRLVYGNSLLFRVNLKFLAYASPTFTDYITNLIITLSKIYRVELHKLYKSSIFKELGLESRSSFQVFQLPFQ